VDTAAGLKQSLRDVRLGGPTGTNAATSSLAMARSLASLAKTAAAGAHTRSLSAQLELSLCPT